MCEKHSVQLKAVTARVNKSGGEQREGAFDCGVSGVTQWC